MTYTVSPSRDQGFSGSIQPIEPSLSDNLIDELARSPRRDDNVVAAILRIEQETEDADATEDPDAAEDGYTIDPCAVSREIAGYRRATGQPHAVPRQYRPAPVKPVRRAPRPATAPTPRRRPRVRAKHSHVAHGGARKASDDGSGDPPQPFRQHVTVEPDGTVLASEDGVLLAIFPSVAEAVRTFLEFEEQLRARGEWRGLSYLDASHPLNSLIVRGMQ